MALQSGLSRRGVGKSNQILCANCRARLEAAIPMAHKHFYTAHCLSTHTGPSKWLEWQPWSIPLLRFRLSQVPFWHGPAQKSMPSEHLRSTGQMGLFGRALMVGVEAAAELAQSTTVVTSRQYYIIYLLNKKMRLLFLFIYLPCSVETHRLHSGIMIANYENEQRNLAKPATIIHNSQLQQNVHRERKNTVERLHFEETYQQPTMKANSLFNVTWNLA